MNYYKEIKNKILDNEIYERVKDISKERHRVLTYFEIGRLLSEAENYYGDSFIYKCALSFEKEFGKKYDQKSLYKMRQFYLLFSEPKWTQTLSQNQKVATLEHQSSKTLYYKDNPCQKVATPSLVEQRYASPNNNISYPIFSNKLTWSHFRCLIPIKNDNKRKYYTNLVIEHNLSVRELESKIKSKEYERLDENTRNKIINKQDLNIKDYVPNPILIKNTNNTDVISEKILHNLIMEDIASFMKELGEGYSFIDSEFKIKIGDRYNYIDLLLYNYLFRCFVVIELKVTEFKSEYIGQILKYMNYIDSNIKTIEDNNTIGIIICKRNNGFYLEYCSDERIITREYKLI